ncbi:hypothetical protein [Tenacibaculum ovolyticum]|nr:hypothetical protein [Tenacibaculum ovolyticum]
MMLLHLDKMKETIQFSESIVLTKDSHVMGNVLGVVGEINHH